jgi:hypothetical protein
MDNFPSPFLLQKHMWVRMVQLLQLWKLDTCAGAQQINLLTFSSPYPTVCPVPSIAPAGSCFSASLSTK